MSSLHDLLADAARRSADYLDGLQERHVAPLPAAVDALDRFDVPLQEQPIAAAEVLRALDEIGSPATMGIGGPRFFGFVMGGSVPAALAADFLTSAWEQNTGMYNITPVTARLEAVALRWLLEVLDLPRDAAGAFVTGTTVAHITALAGARHAVLAKAGWNVEADGLFGAPPITVVVGAEAHPTLRKALGVLGLGRNRVVTVPADDQGRMRLDALPRLSGPAIVCVQAGNVNTGACDPIDDICDVAHSQGAWVHVDGAFGLWARVAPTRAHLVAGIERADSWATDGHKWLNVPYDSGIAFTRDGEALRKAMAITAEYLPSESPNRNPSDYTPELSRRARGVDIWAAMRSLGRSGITEIVERNCRQARRFAEGLSAAGFEILAEVPLNQVLVSFGTPEQTQRAIAALQADGTCWCGGTVWQGRTAMRISVCSWATTDADVEKSLAAMIRAAKR
ncbi:MAG TPA: aminotransferase class V-fold PLP-dependent enzyme [Gemmatimonadaceae bacterium]|nr:aminotransferase class V-fold PLP-dependent enzyme [Gemmatimonadaceae bacterium]